MAEPNFTLTNQYFALSPMVLHATMDAGTSVTLSVTVNGTGMNVQVQLNADTEGNVVYDMAPLVRDLIRRQFRRENIESGYSPYGAVLSTKLDNTYTLQHYVVWASKEKGILRKVYSQNNTSGSAWLLPTGKIEYMKDAPTHQLISAYSREEEDTSVYAKNKKNGNVIMIGDWIFSAPYNIPITYFEELANGEYEVYYGILENGVIFDLTVTDGCFPTDALRDGKMAYVRFCNQWGGLSYAFLQVTRRSEKNKGTYVQKAYALDANPKTEDIYSVYPDRVMIGQEITPSFKAGKDKLSRSELEELQSILVSPMVDMYDVETGEWVPVYPQDSTVTETNDALQEITIDFNLNTEGF